MGLLSVLPGRLAIKAMYGEDVNIIKFPRLCRKSRIDFRRSEKLHKSATKQILEVPLGRLKVSRELGGSSLGSLKFGDFAGMLLEIVERRRRSRSSRK